MGAGDREPTELRFARFLLKSHPAFHYLPPLEIELQLNFWGNPKGIMDHNWRLVLLVVFGSLNGFLLARAASLGEAVDAPGLAWTTSGNAAWFAQTANTQDGVAAAEAGAVGYAQSSLLSAPVTGPGTLVFWASVETPAGATELIAGYDGNFSLRLDEQSPTVGRGWKAYALDVPAGNHNLTFLWYSYASDPAAVGTQHAWVDRVSFADYSGQSPAFVVDLPDVELNEDYPWTLGVAVTGASPFKAILARTGLTWTYLNLTRPQLELNVDRVSANFAGSWQLAVQNPFGAVTSRTFSVTVKPSPPMVWGGPYSTDVGLGAPLELRAQTRGTAPLHHQWQLSGADVPGQNSPTLSLAATTAADAGVYRLVVTNLYGAATSQLATVTLSTSPPQIVQQSASVTVLPGDSALFWVDCTGSSPLYYQWRKDGQDVVGANDASLWFSSAAGTDAGSYRVVVTNLFGTVTSDAVTLTVVDPIAEALDVQDLVFRSYDYLTPWSVVTDTTHDGTDAAQSWPIDHDSYSGLQTALTGPGTLRFWWKVSSEADHDLLKFIVDDTLQTTLSGDVDWQNQSYELGPGDHDLLWLYAKDGSGVQGQDAAWLDQVEWLPNPAIPLAEALDAPTLTFETGDPVPWRTQVLTTHDGVDAAQSGPTFFAEKSSFALTLTGPGRLSFWCRTASDGNARLTFYMDGNDLDTISGNSDWEQQMIPIRAGQHTFTWSYENYNPLTGGQDTAWVDEVTWTPYLLSEALDAPDLVFELFDDWPWLNQSATTHDGVDAVQSTVPPPRTPNWLYAQISGPGTLTFWGKISAAPDDTLMFLLDSSSGSILYREWDWQPFTYEIGPGTHTVGWAFWKGSEEAAGLNAVFVDEVVFTPRRAPTIAVSPEPVKLLKGRSFELLASAVGDPPLQYQWLKDGTNIPGATGTRYARGDCRYEDTGNYAVAVANAIGAVTSSWARVAIVPTFYRIQNLGTLGTIAGSTSEAYDVNNLGEVVGRADIDEAKSYGNRLYHGFVWTDRSSMADLGDGRIAVNVAPTNRLAGYSCAYAINDRFDIVGYYEYRVDPKMDGYAHATHWRQISDCALEPPVSPDTRCPGELVDVHPRNVYPPDTEAVAVNQRRQILLQAGHVWVLAHYGYLLTPQNPADRFSPFTTLSLGGGTGAIDPYALNNAGLIVGRYRENIGGDFPWLYDGSSQVGSDAMPKLFPVPASRQYFTAINDLGVIAGLYYTNSVEGYMMRHAFLQYPDGRLELLPDPFHNLYDLKDINNGNQVVGSEYGGRGVLYTDGYWFVLNDLVQGGEGADLDTANAINDRGQIVGVARFPGVGSRAYLLTPSAPSNQDPVAQDDSLLMPPRGDFLIPTATLLANDTDVDGDRLRIDSVFGSGIDDLTQAGGRVRRDGSTIRYTPPDVGVANDTFRYTVSDGTGGAATARVDIMFSATAPEPTPILTGAEILLEGGFRLSGQAPPGSIVTILCATSVEALYWARIRVLTVGDSGQWSTTLPATEGGRRLFYRAEVQLTGP